MTRSLAPQHFALTATIALLASAGTAQFALTAPDNAYATAEGNSNFVLPWNVTTGGGRVQFVHDSTVFTGQGVTTPIRILGLRYRADAIANTWSGGTYPSVVIDMSTCPFDHLSVTNTFANNHGLDQTNVYNGAVTVLPGTGGSAPAPVYVDIALSTPFVYDPTTGNDLLIDFTVNTGWVGNGGVATGPVDHVGPGATPAALGSRVWISGSPTSPTGNPNFSPTFGYSPVCEFVYAPAVGLWPNFTASDTTGATPLLVQFTDRTVTDDPGGILLWQWDLDGNGSIDSTLQNPTFTYTTCGSYNVTLTVLDAMHGPRTLLRTAFVVTDQVRPGFSFTVTGNAVSFSDTSVPAPTSWAWDFDGDSIVDSTLQNPVWVYANACAVHQVTLTVRRACGPQASTTLGVPVAPNALTTNLATTLGLFGTNVGNLFDVQVLNPAGVSICGITMCPYTDGTMPLGTTLLAEIYVTDAAGGFNAVHNDINQWRLAARATGLYRGGNSGSPQPVAMTLDRLAYLPSGSYGMAVYMLNAGLAFRTGTVTFANSDLSLSLGSSKFGLFTAAAPTASRPWAGTLHYDTLQTGGSAGYGFFGAGCSGSLPISRLVATGLPHVGSTLSVTIDNLPLSVALLMTGLSRTSSPFGPLPLDTSIVGAPGCLGRVSPDEKVLLLGTANAVQWSLGIPNSTGLVGLQAFNQTIVLDPGFNALGAVFSDAAAILIGN